MKIKSLLAFVLLFLLILPIAAAVDLLHHFTPSNIQGANPWGNLISDGTYLYGMTAKLGQYNCGTIFRINGDGSGFLLLHTFAGGGADGREPYGSLILSGSTLYGMTQYGGDSDQGTVFKIETAGSGFSVVHDFASGADDGAEPRGSLLLSGAVLFGMTTRGGDYDSGTIFQMNTDGSGFVLLHEFIGFNVDGRIPYGSLLLSGSTLYGVTGFGGDSNMGTIFKMETNGSGYDLLHEFIGGAGDGERPEGALIISGSTLYGMTLNGGDSDRGTIFTIQTDGSLFTLMHEFAGGDDDGQYPHGDLILAGSNLYGLTSWGGGGFNSGTIFTINANGSGFALLHRFGGGVSDGSIPRGSLLLVGAVLFGMSERGGDDDLGTIFKIGDTGAGFSLLHDFVRASNSDGRYPFCPPVISGTTLYGMTLYGGRKDKGMIFKIETNGTGYTVLHEFAGGAFDGENPYGSLLLSGTTLYGMTNGGGYLSGTVFKIETDGTGFMLLHKFNRLAGDGAQPFGDLLLSGTTLYGMTENGGANNFGTIFKMETDGTGYALLHEFAGGAADGKSPYGSLVLSGTTLYGMTEKGGADDMGTVFKLEAAGSGFALLHEFAGGATDGRNPRGSLIISGTTLFGMTDSGGGNDKGTIFTLSTSGSGFALLHEFAGGYTDGKWPKIALTISGTTLYGQTGYGGNWDCGTVFKIETSGSGFSVLHNFARGAGDGAYPNGSLLFSEHILYGTASFGGNTDAGVLFSFALPSITVISPNSGENWNSGDMHNITWDSTGTVGNVNINYSTNNGSTWSPLAANTANDGIYAWTVPAITPSALCLVRISDVINAATHDVSDGVFSISSGSTETVSIPSRPTGDAAGLPDTSYTFSSGSANSNQGHSVQYKFDWDDGSDSGWLAVGTTSASHSWSVNGTFNIRAMARCVDHPTVESLWSDTHAITISDGSSAGYYNSPASRQILPEVIWAPATGGGTWVSDVQVVDVSGGSQVTVYYSTAAGRRGPFLLWNNSAGSAMSSVKYANLLQTIDGLDSGAFTYDGTVGAVEFATQDGAHLIHVAVREMNGNYAKTFPGLNLVDAETAGLGRNMIIPNLANNATYRTTCGFYNPTADAVTMELKLLGASGVQTGGTITRTLAGYEFTAFNPFTEAGLPYPGSSYDNVNLKVEPTTGSGSVMCFGATANNTSNDPAAHLAVQASGYDNGPSNYKILPEVIWAPATGGGTWVSDVQVVDVSGGSQVSVYYNTASGRRGPFLLWNNSGGSALSSVKYANLLQTIDGLDSGAFTYNGTVGAVEFATQDSGHLIHVAVRELNGNYAKTFPGLNLVNAETAGTGRLMIIPNLANNATYRTTCGFYNPTADAVTMELKLLGASGVQTGGTITRTLAGYEFTAFNPFTEAGLPYPGSSYDNVTLKVKPTTGSGSVMCFGATANNTSNDPAAHIAVQGQ